MLNSYSASKKKSFHRRSDFDVVISNSRMVYQIQEPLDTKNPYLDQKWPIMSRRSIHNTNQRESVHEKEKDNQNIVQSRLDRYNALGQSPRNQSYISPLKQNYDPKGRRSITGRQKNNNKQNSFDQNQSKYTYKIGYSKQNTYNYNAKKHSQYKKIPPLTSRSSIGYENQFRDDLQIQDQPYTPRQSYQKNQNLAITFSCNNITPKKSQLQLPDQLVEKSQFLRQRMDRINRMTPKGLTMRQKQRGQSITPEKYPKKQKETLIQQSTSSIIVRYNKYCDQKLPLETIYDSQQHKLQHREREPAQQAQEGLQQINSLSKKISQRLKQIINRHSN